MELLAE
jgi:cytochrome c5